MIVGVLDSRETRYSGDTMVGVLDRTLYCIALYRGFLYHATSSYVN